jgi:glutaminyl-peptide cyclotransferase
MDAPPWRRACLACVMWSRGAWSQVAIAVVTAGLSTATAPPTHAESVPIVVPTVLAVLPHDPAAFSEGLEFDGQALYESTGEVGKSQLRQVDPATGEVLRSAELPPEYFGEGITIVGDRIWQLTYKNGVVIAWDKASFAPVRQVAVDGMGWGLCRDGNRFIRSDGSERLRFHDINTFAETGGVRVTQDGQPVTGLDELECVGGQVWAATWPVDRFVRINPATGVVNLVLDTSRLWAFGERNKRQVVSSIAHIAGDEFLISGKEWPSNLWVRIDEGG